MAGSVPPSSMHSISPVVMSAPGQAGGAEAQHSTLVAFPGRCPVPLHVSQALLRTASGQLARESHEPLIAAIAPG